MTSADRPSPFFESLAEAKSHRGASVVLEADCGGQFLLSIPASQVACDEPVLVRLLADLEAITWGGGFDVSYLGDPVDAQLSYFRPDGAENDSGGLRLDEELEDLLLRDQIARVLRGEQPRLQLAHCFPRNPVFSLQEAKRFPKSRVSLHSTRGRHPLVNCAARIVEIDEPALNALVDDLDGWIGWPSTSSEVSNDPRIFYARQDSAPSFELLNADLRLGTRLLLPIRDEIERILRGQQARIEPRPRIHHFVTDRGETVDITLLPGERFLCPVCASVCLGDPPYLRTHDSHGRRIDPDHHGQWGTPPLNICRTCATHFGVSDFPDKFPGLSLPQIWERLRVRWLSRSTSIEGDLARLWGAFAWNPPSPG